ncbi:formylglycine-generating enzyme family protein [bacterium]|nr:formylglycine-generating enzyme family protein [bacterium]
MVWVPPGGFMMGTTDDDAAYAVTNLGASAEDLEEEQPAHQVHITRGFWLGRCQVTNEQYARFLNGHGKTKTAVELNRLICLDALTLGIEAVAGSWRPRDGLGWMGRRPMVEVSWHGAKAYCDVYGLDLPTEAQWEYAARGQQGLRYPWGPEWNPLKCCNNENKGTGYPRMMEVGSCPAGDSWCGACDMGGNVVVWCADWYGCYASSPEDDPAGPDAGEFRVVRGGAWDAYPNYCRAALRRGRLPDARDCGLGFRVCSSPKSP